MTRIINPNEYLIYHLYQFKVIYHSWYFIVFDWNAFVYCFSRFEIWIWNYTIDIIWCLQTIFETILETTYRCFFPGLWHYDLSRSRWPRWTDPAQVFRWRTLCTHGDLSGRGRPAWEAWYLMEQLTTQVYPLVKDHHIWKITFFYGYINRPFSIANCSITRG